MLMPLMKYCFRASPYFKSHHPYKHYKQKKAQPQGLCLFCWLRRRDLNPRPFGPKETYTDFLRDFHGFSELSCPKSVLSDALTSTIST